MNANLARLVVEAVEDEKKALGVSTDVDFFGVADSLARRYRAVKRIAKLKKQEDVSPSFIRNLWEGGLLSKDRALPLESYGKLVASGKAVSHHDEILKGMLEEFGASAQALSRLVNFEDLIISTVMAPMERGESALATERQQALLFCASATSGKSAILPAMTDKHHELILTFSGYISHRTEDGFVEFYGETIKLAAERSPSPLLVLRAMAHDHFKSTKSASSEHALNFVFDTEEIEDSLPVDWRVAPYANAANYYIETGHELKSIPKHISKKWSVENLIDKAVELQKSEKQFGRALRQEALKPKCEMLSGNYSAAISECDKLRKEARALENNQGVFAELRLWEVEGDAYAKMSESDAIYRGAAEGCYQTAMIKAKNTNAISKAKRIETKINDLYSNKKYAEE